jgi:hypothetical protein
MFCFVLLSVNVGGQSNVSSHFRLSAKLPFSLHWVHSSADARVPDSTSTNAQSSEAHYIGYLRSLHLPSSASLNPVAILPLPQPTVLSTPGLALSVFTFFPFRPIRNRSDQAFLGLSLWLLRKKEGKWKKLGFSIMGFLFFFFFTLLVSSGEGFSLFHLFLVFFFFFFKICKLIRAIRLARRIINFQ